MLDPWPSKNGGLPPWTDRPTMDRWGLLMSIRRIAQALLQESHAFLTNVWKRGKNGCQMGAKWVPLFAIISLVQLVLGFSISYQSISSWTSQNSRVQKNRKPSRDPVPMATNFQDSARCACWILPLSKEVTIFVKSFGSQRNGSQDWKI